jgi:outer membrane protein assembly factor BamD
MNHAKLQDALRVLLCLAGALLPMGGCAGNRIPLGSPMQFERGVEKFEQGDFGAAGRSFKAFTRNYPSDPRVARAQYLLGESYLRDGDLPLAEVEFGILMSEYSYSPYVDDALLGKARAAWEQAPRAERDQTKAREALRLVEQYLIVYADSSLVEDAARLKNEILLRLSKKDYLNAQTYLKLDDNEAAEIYLSKVIETYPDGEWGIRARLDRGRVLERLGRPEEAEQDYRFLVERHPHAPEAEEALGRLRRLQEES